MKNVSILILSVLLGFGIFNFENEIRAAEKYPSKPITVMVNAEAGSGQDLITRRVYPRAAAMLGQPIMIVNKPGAGGSIALREVHDAKPDGYTLCSSTPTIFTNKLQGISSLGHSDFSVVGTIFFSFPWLIASTKTQHPYKSFEEVFLAAKASPGKVKLTTSGVGYMWWIMTMVFQQKTGLKFNVIPQPGTAGFIVSQVAGGHADIGVSSTSPAKPMIDAGMVNLLAVFAPHRAPGYEKVPTLKELGYDVGVGSFGVIVGPPKMPKEILDKLAKAFEAGVNDPEYQKFMNENHYAGIYMPSDKVIPYMDEQRNLFRAVMGETGILKEK